MDGRAFEGLGPIIIAGMIALAALALLAPPAAILLLAWLLEPRTGVDPLSIYAWAQGAGAAVLVALWGGDRLALAIQARRNRLEHEEFMRLRRLFYRNDEICGETLASLRKRAAAL